MFDDLIYWLNVLTVLFSATAMVFSGKNLWNNKKLAKHIPIYIDRDGAREDLGIEIARRDFNRSELFGVLGVLQADGRFGIEYFSTKEFYDQLASVQKAQKDEFVVYLKPHDQFVSRHHTS